MRGSRCLFGRFGGVKTTKSGWLQVDYVPWGIGFSAMQPKVWAILVLSCAAKNAQMLGHWKVILDEFLTCCGTRGRQRRAGCGMWLQQKDGELGSKPLKLVFSTPKTSLANIRQVGKQRHTFAWNV